MYYSKVISTGLIIESLSGNGSNDLGAIKSLRDSAEQTYSAEDIEVAEGTAVEIATMIDAKQVAIDLANPMDAWQRTMAKSDSSMTRMWEDFLTLNGTDGLPQITKDRHISKVALRATKPGA